MKIKVKSMSLADQEFYDLEMLNTEFNTSGKRVFAGTRLPVFQIGQMLANGQTKVDILTNYPYLDTDSLRFAKLYYEEEMRLALDNKEPESKSHTEAVIDMFKKVIENESEKP